MVMICKKTIMQTLKKIYPVDKIENAVSYFFGLSVSDMFLNTRKKHIIIARQFFFYMCKEHTKMSLANIGKIPLNHKSRDYDHATVLHAHRRVCGFIDVYPEYPIYYNGVLNLIENQKNIVMNDEIDLLAISINNTREYFLSL